MRYCADLHVHSKYSRATSRDCDLEHLAYWGALKGLAVIGTGDFTHPAWRAELKEKLVPAEPGLFRLNEASEQRLAAALPAACRNPVRFMLSVEISTIYKKGERTRKIHHLLYAPSFEAAERIAERLARIGNIAADGRPILGLDSRALLEITLEADASAFLVPAHIWTPWFAVLGSRSGFDSILECYGDLASHIFALETGLSSDPPMNWRVSALDRFRLMSSSDAHSPAKLGREATVFETALDYFALRRALMTGEGYGGTIEFFPEEGKYHLDGHRKCAVRLAPEETRRLDGRCPVCGEALTVGVLHRVEALADREEPVAPATAGPVANLVPLPEILSEISGTGAASQTVARRHERLLGDLGPELEILSTVPLEDIARADSSLLAEGIGRLRQGRVLREAGYDGEYGTIHVFERNELEQRTAGGLLFSLPAAKGLKAGVESTGAEASPARPTHPGPAAARSAAQVPERAALSTASARLAVLDDEQRAAADHVNGALLVIAGPGSGKTRMLTHRIAHLIADCGAEPSSCLAVTFTRRAAKEMRERLAALLPDRAAQIAIHTFHSLGLSLLKEHRGSAGLHRGFRIATEGERRGVLRDRLGVSEARAEALLRAISRAKRSLGPVPAELKEAMAAYRQGLERSNAVDLDDLIGLALEALETDPLLAARLRGRFRW
ncbi:MAG TPA: UvrD-helicase domain-containing protein, partial [Alphaproteobacteria bacterium]|nr:UvrD-helicase domain-containing protein [Alphaproteobacteria bacterium]